MKTTLLVLTALLALAHPVLAIVNGGDADIKDYPYTLSVISNGSHICGAVLVAPKWALTSAHCVETVDPTDLTIRAGSSTHSDGQVVSVTAGYTSPFYDPTAVDYDLTILELAEEVTHPDAGTIVPVDVGYLPPNGAMATVTGWGDLQEGGPPSDVLQEVAIPIVTRELCDLAYGDLVTDRMVCAGFLINGGQGPCEQDYGGPLVLGGQLIGVASWSIGCAEGGKPGVFTSVSHPSLRNFIKDTTGI